MDGVRGERARERTRWRGWLAIGHAGVVCVDGSTLEQERLREIRKSLESNRDVSRLSSLLPRHLHDGRDRDRDRDGKMS